MINKKIITFLFIITAMISISAMDKPLSPKNSPIELKSSDNQIIAIPWEIALQSPTLALTLKSFEEGKTKSIPFTTINGETLTTVVKILKAFYNHQDLKGKALLDGVEKDATVYDSQAILLLRAFDFLDFMPGVRLVARYLSMHSSVTQDPRSYLENATTHVKQFLYGKPIMDHVISLIKTNQFTYNTTNEIGRIYYLIMNKDISELERARWNFKSPTIIDEDKLTFSLRDYLDYLPEIIKKRHKPNSLDLDELKLIDLDGLEDIPDIQNVTDLELNRNKMTSLPNLSSLGLNNLTRLMVISGQLKELPATCLHGLKKLEILAISFHSFIQISATVFQGLNNLRVLQLYHNKLSELPPTLFQGLNNLKNLTLGNNQLQSLPTTLFNGLINLEYLSLSFNQLTELPDSLFVNLTNLRKLDLINNQLKWLKPQLFIGLTNLRKLEVYGNKLPADNITELRNALPQVKVKTHF